MSKMLSSWKEIAQYFGKGVRTVQRWEKTLNLPIHRPPGAPSNVVLARTADLDAWMHRGPAERAAVMQAAPAEDSALAEEISRLEAAATSVARRMNVQVNIAGPEASAMERLEALTHLLENLGSEGQRDQNYPIAA